MTKKRILLFVAAVSLILGWYYLGYAPDKRRLADLNTQINSVQSQLTEYQTIVAQVPALIKASSSLSEQKQRQTSILFGRNEILYLIDQIRSKANDQSLTVTDIEPTVAELLALRATASIPGEPLFLDITVRIKGDYIGFGRFVEQIESLPYFRGVNYCSIIGPADQSTPPLYSFGFKALLGEGKRA